MSEERKALQVRRVRMRCDVCKVGYMHGDGTDCKRDIVFAHHCNHCRYCVDYDREYPYTEYVEDVGASIVPLVVPRYPACNCSPWVCRHPSGEWCSKYGQKL